MEQTTDLEDYDSIAWFEEHILKNEKAYSLGLPRIQAFLRTITLDESPLHDEKTLPQLSNKLYKTTLALMYSYGMQKFHMMQTNPDTARDLDARWDEWYATGEVSQYARWFATLVHGIAPLDLTSDEAIMEPFLRTATPGLYLIWPFEELRGLKLMQLEMSAKFERDTLVGVRKRALFDTARSFMGLGPQDTKPGDVLCVLHGSKFPVLLRPHPDDQYYQFVGTCYVYGLMYGEPVQDQDQATFPLEMFVIK